MTRADFSSSTNNPGILLENVFKIPWGAANKSINEIKNDPKIVNTESFLEKMFFMKDDISNLNIRREYNPVKFKSEKDQIEKLKNSICNAMEKKLTR